MSRIWTTAQLSKWRIRKAWPGELPPWAAKLAVQVARLDADRDAAHTRRVSAFAEQSPWWVYPPGSADAECCLSAWEAALNHVLQSIVVARQSPEERLARQEGRL